MSSNNCILIEENNKGVYTVKDVDVENFKGFEIGFCNELTLAIEMANDYMAENEVEYGIHFKLLKKK